MTANLWGWIFLHGVGELTDIEGRLNAEKYIEILEVMPTLSGEDYIHAR